jgi:hypothetical protein
MEVTPQTGSGIEIQSTLECDAGEIRVALECQRDVRLKPDLRLRDPDGLLKRKLTGRGVVVHGAVDSQRIERNAKGHSHGHHTARRRPIFAFPGINLTIVSCALDRAGLEIACRRPAIDVERGSETPLTAEIAVSRRVVTRFRVFVLAVVATLAAMSGVSIWRMRSLGDLPDVGDPFDVAAARQLVVMSDDDNAFVQYKEARRQLTRLTDVARSVDWPKLTWSRAGKGVRDYLEANRPALETWREGTERPDAMYHQPGEMAADTLLPVVQDLRSLGRLAALEGSRHEEQGEMEAAWIWYKAMLRSSRHVGRHGVLIERLVGAAVFEESARRIVHWAADSKVDAALLHRALADVQGADTLTVPISDTMKLDYIVCLRDLAELRVMVTEIPMPGGPNGLLEKIVAASGAKSQVQRVRLRATNDVERSRRILRLLYANWLPQVDKRADQRARIAIRKPTLIYAADPNAPPTSRVVAPEDLDRAIGQTLLAQQFFRPSYWSEAQGGAPWSGWAWEGDRPLAREPRRRAVLIVKLAAELYRRERGKLAANAGSLLEGYLKELPEGIKLDEPIPAGID